MKLITRRRLLISSVAVAILPVRFHWPKYETRPDSGMQSFAAASGYAIEWDRSLWYLMEEFSALVPLGPDEADFLALLGIGANESRSVGTATYFSVNHAYHGNAIVALARFAERTSSERPPRPVVDDDGLPMGANTSNRAWSASVIVSHGVELYHYQECRTLFPGDSVVQISYSTPLDGLEARRPYKDQLLTSLRIAGQPTAVSIATPSPRSELQE